MAGRPKQSREMAELKGAIKKNPQRYRGEVPKSDIKLEPGFYPFTANLTKGQEEAWDYLLSVIHPIVLTQNDEPWLELTCRLLAEYRKSGDSFPIPKLAKYMEALSKMGLNIVDRQRLALNPTAEKNEFEEWGNKGRK